MFFPHCPSLPTDCHYWWTLTSNTIHWRNQHNIIITPFYCNVYQYCYITVYVLTLLYCDEITTNAGIINFSNLSFNELLICTYNNIILWLVPVWIKEFIYIHMLQCVVISWHTWFYELLWDVMCWISVMTLLCIKS